MLGYSEALRGLAGIVAPLLAGFSLTAIATIVTARMPPRLAGWAIAALATDIALLLFSMQAAFLSLTQNSTPADILMWQPEARVSEAELQVARAAQAADLSEMARRGKLSFAAYDLGLVAFLLGVLLLMIPRHWSAGDAIGVAAIAVVLLLETWWGVADRCERIRHPIARKVEPSHKAGWEQGPPPKLDEVGLAAVLDRAPQP